MSQTGNLSMLSNSDLEAGFMEVQAKVTTKRYHELQQSCNPVGTDEESFLSFYREMRDRGLVSASLLPLPPVREYDSIHDSLDRMQRHFFFQGPLLPTK